MSRKTNKKTILLAVLLGTMFISAIASPLINTSFTKHTTASVYYDPIAVGNWQYDQYDSIIVQQAQNYGLDPFMIKGQIMFESDFNTYAQSSILNAACGWTHDLGLMQINPYCSGLSGVNLFDPATNIHYGTYFMWQFYNEFGDYNLALQAYNMGASAVWAGQRNWAYSNAVDSYAQQFRNEHNSLYGGSTTYTVQSGDTLTSIAAKYGTTYQAIAQANGISYPYTIYVGQQLTIPSPSGSFTYIVQPGDTLSIIGQRYGVSWQSIAQANGISYPYTIYVGESLTIP